MPPKISIITLTWNQLSRATKPYIESLYENTSVEDFELILVDNGSTDGTVEYLKKLEKEKTNVKVIYNSTNHGYPTGNNQGIKIATGDYIGLFNNDIFFNDISWLSKMINFIKSNDNVGLVSPRILNCMDCNLKNYYQFKYKKSDNLYEKILKPFFCCVMFDKSLIEEIGLLDENFSPAFFEDDDYSFRTVKTGKINYICNSVSVFHNESLSSSKLEEHSEILRKNEKYYFNKHGFLAEYCWKKDRNFNVLEEKFKIMEKSIFFIPMKISIKVRTRFRKIFRGLLRKLK